MRAVSRSISDFCERGVALVARNCDARAEPLRNIISAGLSDILNMTFMIARALLIRTVFTLAASRLNSKFYTVEVSRVVAWPDLALAQKTQPNPARRPGLHGGSTGVKSSRRLSN